MINSNKILISYDKWCEKVCEYLSDYQKNKESNFEVWVIGGHHLIKRFFSVSSCALTFKAKSFSVYDFLQNLPSEESLAKDIFIILDNINEILTDYRLLFEKYLEDHRFITRASLLPTFNKEDIALGVNNSAIIKNEDITFVIQGTIERSKSYYLGIEYTISSIKYWFPSSKIVLSTWEGQLTDDLEVDEIIKNKDPGPLPPLHKSDTKPNNCNRQIISTSSGLRAVKTKYAVKIRSDLVVIGREFLLEFIKNTELAINSKIFQNPIIFSQFFTLSNKGFERIPFHISDHMNFGLTSDLILLWNQNLMTYEEAKWFQCNDHDKKGNVAAKNFNSKFAVEQFIFKDLLKAKNYCNITNIDKCNHDIYEKYKNFLKTDCIIVDYDKLGITIPKLDNSFYSTIQQSNCVYYKEWLAIKNDDDYFEFRFLKNYMLRLINRYFSIKTMRNFYSFCKDFFNNVRNFIKKF